MHVLTQEIWGRRHSVFLESFCHTERKETEPGFQDLSSKLHVSPSEYKNHMLSLNDV
jgi:hypothetical protein